MRFFKSPQIDWDTYGVWHKAEIDQPSGFRTLLLTASPLRPALFIDRVVSLKFPNIRFAIFYTKLSHQNLFVYRYCYLTDACGFGLLLPNISSNGLTCLNVGPCFRDQKILCNTVIDRFWNTKFWDIFDYKNLDHVRSYVNRSEKLKYIPDVWEDQT